MPRYTDMENLGSVYAARSLFSYKGWRSSRHAGRWAVRFCPDSVLVLELARDQNESLKVPSSGVQRAVCYPFNAAYILPEPGVEDAGNIYDLAAEPVSEYDWSADADYISHVVRALPGVGDQRLDDVIRWLELHRDQQTGEVSATGADSQKAFDAIRSGELASRLSSDREVMKIYLAAVHDDPAVTRAVAEVLAENSTRNRESAITAIISELAADYEEKKTQQDLELKERERILAEALDERLKARASSLEHELEQQLVHAHRKVQEKATGHIESLTAEIAQLTTERNSILTQRDQLRVEALQIATDLVPLLEQRRLIEEGRSRAPSLDSAISVRAEGSARTLGSLPDNPQSTLLPIQSLLNAISRSVLLTEHGKALMERFIILMLAGEVPVIEGERLDDFTLVAESLIAAGRLVTFDLDTTVLTSEDIWSRPGSGFVSAVAQASERSRKGEETFLVQLRGIERSAARYWYPELASLSRRGFLPRRMMLFASVTDSEAEEVKALPGDACRMAIADAITPKAWLVAPALLSSGQAAITFQLDPGKRADDLSETLDLFPDLGTEVDLAMSMRIARIMVETLRLRPGNREAALMIAREFCKGRGNPPKLQVTTKEIRK
jgi:hypothetical protein